jgi:DNA-binding NarL/FixJ family response regulator
MGASPRKTLLSQKSALKMQPPSDQRWEFLIICADAHVHKALSGAVHAVGGIAHATPDTTSALAYITRRKLDGIFIDTRTDGALGFVGNIRRGGSNRFSVIFACVGEDEEVSRLLNAGVNFVVHKPLDAAELEAVLRNASEMIANERRRYMRHQLTLPVMLKATGREYRVVTANISHGGMAVRCSEKLAPGSAIHYVLHLPHAEPVSGQGEVAWSNPEGVAGIRFYFMGDQAKNALWQWMDKRSA